MSRSHPSVRYELFVGVDIAAATASAAWQTAEKKSSKASTIEQTPDGFTHLHRALSLTHVAPSQVLVVMEATGTYWLSPSHLSGPAGLCGERDQPGPGAPFCQSFAQTSQDRCH